MYVRKLLFPSTHVPLLILSLNHWGAQCDGREQAVHQGWNRSKRKAALTTLLLEFDEQL